MYLGFAWFNLVFVMITLYMIIVCAIAAIMLCVCHSKHDIQMYFRKHKKYILNNEEKKLWGSIINKAQSGYHEWNAKEDKYDYLSPWMSPHLTKEEQNLIDKIHEYFYGEHWYITMPISASQCYYQMFYDIKDKIK